MWTPDEIAKETRNRILIAVAAYAYEFRSESILSDRDYDALALAIRPDMPTLRPSDKNNGRASRVKKLDQFFRTTFHPDTGQWIHRHPELGRVAATYENFHVNKKARA